MLSNCGHDERGLLRGGEAGDQTGQEYHIVNWYNRPWNCVLRHPDTQFMELIANLAVLAANNDNIGYDQGQRTTFWEELQKVNYNPAAITTKCEADCSSSTCAIIKAAAKLMNKPEFDSLPITSTCYMRAELKKRGFIVFTDSQYLTSDAYNERGDILLNDGAHVAIEVGDASSDSSLPTGGLNINFEATSPYIVGVPASVTNFDAETMKNNQVMGCMLFAGARYTSSHSLRNDYVSSTLRKQVECCKSGNLPWALYAPVRARTVSEAEKECERLYYVVSAYPPKLSLWLKLEMGMSKSTNKKILDYYYDQMVKWGFKNSCGIYVDEDELKQIDWLEYQEKFYLWYIDHSQDINNWIEKLPSTESFIIEYEGKPVTQDTTSVTSANTTTTGNSTSSTSSSTSSNGNVVVERARGEMGKPYQWAAVGPLSYDCSGLVSYALTGKHERLGTTTTFMGWKRAAVPVPGDICTNSHHCGVYIGSGRMIHAPHSGSTVQEGNVHSDMIYVKYSG